MIDSAVEFSDRKLSDILITAFEGGVGYWCTILGYVKPTKPCPVPDMEEYRHGWYPLAEGGGMILADSEETWECDDVTPDKLPQSENAAFETLVFDRNKLKRGLALVAARRPAIFARIVDDQYDAGDADVVVQYGCFGDEVFC